MVETKSERLVGALDAFLATSPDVEATAVVTFDGLTMASALPEGMDDDRVGAMSAALLSLGEQAARGLGRGELHQLFVEADGGFVFLMSAQDQAVLVAVTGREAKIGFILYEMRRAAWDVGAVLDGGSAPSEPSEPGDGEPAAAVLREVGGAGGRAEAAPAEDEWPARSEADHEDAVADVAGGHAVADEHAVAADRVSDSAAPSWREPAATFGAPAWSDAAAGRDPFGDHDLDEPSYVATNGRGTSEQQP